MRAIVSSVMASLPPAIHVLVGVIAADAGRARAETLLMIVGADPVSVRQHANAIDTELGPQSPGVAALSALIEQAEQAVSTSSLTVARQHVISEVVLRKFVQNVPPNGRVLAQVELSSGRLDLIRANDVGYVENFVPVDSKATEDLWQQVETRLYQAIKAARGGTALGDPAHISTLRNIVALHFVRSPHTLEIHNRTFGDTLNEQLDRTAKTPWAAEAFRQRYGLVPAGLEGMRRGAELVHERVVTLHNQGSLFRISVQNLYEKVRDRFDVRGVEILTPANPGKEFLLGDVPAITITSATGEFGLSQGVTVDEADMIFMSLAPRLLVVIGPANAARSISDDDVDTYNEMQVREARDFVLHRPGANFGASIAASRN
jgi:hypothetical protein